MKDKLAKALNEVRDSFIEEAAEGKKYRVPKWVPLIAAVLAVVIFLSSFLDTWTLGAMAISQADYGRYSKPNYEAVQLVSDQLQPFLEASIGQILSGTGEQNKAFSPINLYMAMAMTAELSSGNEQLLQLLETQSLESLRSQANLVWNACYLDKGNKTLLANSVWLRRDLDFDKTILDTLAETYFASSYAADFGSQSTNRAIASWLDQQTGNLLKDKTAKTDLSADTLFALYSTVYYQAKWTSAFSAISNTKAVFHGVTDTTCTFMNKKEMNSTYYWGADYGAVRLNLKDGSYMWLVLPDGDKTVGDVLTAGEWLQQILGTTENMKAMKVNLSLPKFDITASGDLREDLQALGVTEIFDPNAGCFGDFIKADTPAWIGAVNQATRVAVDEEGVTAASYIEIPGAGSAMPPEEIIDFVLDRPFLFVITNYLGLPLFAGVVRDM